MNNLKASIAAILLTLIAVGCSSNGTSSTPVVIPPSPPALTGSYTAGIPASVAVSQAARGADGRTWFTEFNSPAGDGVAAVTTAGVVTKYSTGAGSQANAIILGPDNNIWVGGYGPGIYKITTAGVVTPYALAGSHIAEFTLGADNNIWFADYGNDTIGKITTAGVITSYPLPAGASPCGVASGGDGNLWLTDCVNGAVD